MQKYKVFYNNKFLLISNNKISCNECKTSFILTKEIINKFINDENSESFHIISNNPKEIFHFLMQKFIFIEAAGGLVENESSEILLIYRLENWDLPKGKIEKNELPYESAIREVKEECGLTIKKVEKQLDSTFHIYKMNNRFYLKKSFWYKMNYRGKEKLIPQLEEDIKEAKWVNKNEIKEYFNNMFPSIKELLIDSLI